jgi:glycosyltransferase involved in cell wall biosynthesis
MDGPDPEVIVVDNTQGDSETKRVSTAAGARYLAEPRLGLSRARNTGMDAATGELVAFLDDDAIADSAWLSRHVDVLGDDSLMGSTGRILPLATQDGQGSFDLGEHAFVVDRSNPLWFERASFGGLGNGSNMVLKRRAFENGLHFRETLGLGTNLGGFEDHYLFFTMIKGGARVAYVPAAVVRHEDPELSAEPERRRVERGHRYTAAYLTMLLVEEPGFRRRTLRYIIRTIRGQPPVPWRSEPPPNPLKVLADGYRGPLLYLRNALDRR